MKTLTLSLPILILGLFAVSNGSPVMASQIKTAAKSNQSQLKRQKSEPIQLKFDGDLIDPYAESSDASKNNIIPPIVKGRDSGGANGINGRLLDSSYVELPQLPGYPEYLEVHRFLKIYTPLFAEKIKSAEQTLEWYVIKGSLPSLADEIGFEIESEQIAIQDDKTVYVDEDKLDEINVRLSSDEMRYAKSKRMLKAMSREMLILHEGLLCLLTERNREMGLGLSKADIHKRVRRVNARLFSMFLSSARSKVGIGQKIRDLLLDNDFGYWPTVEEHRERGAISDTSLMPPNFN